MFVPLGSASSGRRCAQLIIATSLLLLALMWISSEDLRDGLVASSVRSYVYRRLINDFSFLGTHFTITRQEARRFSDFAYLLDRPDACSGQDVLLLVSVRSAPRHADRRADIRSTWGNETRVLRSQGVAVKVVFFLGAAEPGGAESVAVREDLEREHRLHGDLIQRDFVDSYRNLTLKLLSQFHWARSRCGHARFLMTVDDDVFVHTPNLVGYLREAARTDVSGLWVGRLHSGAPALRSRNSKHRVSYETYPRSTYPDYTSGGGYVVSNDVVEKIYRATLTLNATIHVDDAFMGICAHVAGVTPRDHAFFGGGSKTPYHPCVYRQMMTSHGHHGQDMHDLWKAATDPRVEQAASGPLGETYCKAVKLALLCLPFWVDTYHCTL